jgi:hypothetical protein
VVRVGGKSAASKAVEAAVTSAATVAAAAANRAAAGTCFAACPQGMVCDAKTGLCVRPGEALEAPEPEYEVPALDAGLSTP